MVSVWPGSGTNIGSKLTLLATESYVQTVEPRESTLGRTFPSIFTVMVLPPVRSGVEFKKKVVRNPNAVFPRFWRVADQLVEVGEHVLLCYPLGHSAMVMLRHAHPQRDSGLVRHTGG